MPTETPLTPTQTPTSITPTETPEPTRTVSFPDYYPVNPATHGRKTFEWTYGNTGSFVSSITGTRNVSYQSGDVLATEFSGGLAIDIAINTGEEVWFVGGTSNYVSTDCNMSDHPATWRFSTITDDMLLDQGTFYYVTQDISKSDATCELVNDQAILFDIQDVTVPFGQYQDSVIIWWIDKSYTFTELNFWGKDVELGIVLPDSTQTGGYAVTDFDVYGLGVGLLAWGDIDAESGNLNELMEMVDHALPIGGLFPYSIYWLQDRDNLSLPLNETQFDLLDRNTDTEIDWLDIFDLQR